MQAQNEFQKQEYVAAEETLYKVHALKNDLNAQEQKVLVDLLSKVGPAIDGQVVAEAQLKIANKAFKSGDFKTAQKYYSKLQSFAFLKAKDLKSVRKNLQLVKTKIQTGDNSPVGADFAGAKTEAKSNVSEVNKARSQSKTAEGKKALAEQEYEKAKLYFGQALELNPSNKEAKAGLEEVKEFEGDDNVHSTLQAARDLQRSQREGVLREYAKLMQKSHALLAIKDADQDEDNFARAEKLAEKAGNLIKNNSVILSNLVYTKKLEDVSDQLHDIGKRKEKFEKDKLKRQQTRIAEDLKGRQKRERDARRQRITDLRRTAEKYLKAKKYIEAKNIYKEILNLVPGDVGVQHTIIALEQTIISTIHNNSSWQRDYNIAKQRVLTQEASIPWSDLIVYPHDWVELSQQRKKYGASASTDSEENNLIRRKMQQRLDSIEWDKLGFKDIIDTLKGKTGINFYCDWTKLNEASDGIADKQITIQLRGITVETALKLALSAASSEDAPLGYVIQDGIVKIDTKENLDKLLYTRAYDIRDLLIRIPNFVGPRVDVKSIGQDTGGTTTGGGVGGGGGGGGGLGGLGDDDSDRPEDKETDLVSKKEKITQVLKMITDTIAFDSWKENGGSATLAEQNGLLLISQTAENHRKISSVIKSLREDKTIQISIEARFITVSTGYLNQIGVDLDFYFNIGSSTPSGHPNYSYPGTGTPANPNQPPANWAGRPGSRKFSPIGAKSGSAGFANYIGTSNGAFGAQSIGSMVSNSAMTIAGTFLDDIQVDFFIRATQAHSETRMLTAPRITLFNGQRAYISIAANQAYVAGVEPIVSQNQVGYRPLIRYAPTGSMLDVDATVSHDRRYVTMTIKPQLVTLRLETTDGSVGGIPYVDAGGTRVGLPNFTINDLQTTVCIPDKGTLLIGGQRMSGQQRREMGTPIISRIPVLNRMFQNKARVHDERTLLILIKPEIIITDDAARNPELRTGGTSRF